MTQPVTYQTQSRGTHQPFLLEEKEKKVAGRFPNVQVS